MGRPSVALCCMLKNEFVNLPKLLASVKGCFDVIHLTDTGSTDGSIELIEEYVKGPNPSDTKIKLHHFEWVDDFAASRNRSFEPAQTDYVAWLDLDDVLNDAASFSAWRDHTMQIADYWVATYHYSSDDKGNPNCSFARERVVRRDLGFKWRYFVHEGILPISPHKQNINAQYATNWSVVHKRTEADLKADKSRNLRLFEKHKESLDPRMKYYYGKELFENGKALESFQWLVTAAAEEKIEMHDRILALQYACMAAMQCNQSEKAIQLAFQGLQLNPNRAEFLCVIGDCYLKMNRVQDAVPYLTAAKACAYQDPKGLITGPIFVQEDLYRFHPRHQLARAYVHMGQLKNAEAILKEAQSLGFHPDTKLLQDEIEKIRPMLELPDASLVAKTDEIVISCHPNGFYEWDEEIARSVGVGGSEIAVIRMARELHKKTGRVVRVFNNRTSSKRLDGVYYEPAQDAANYFQKFEPKVHIAWRHANKLTNAPTFVWCHDLFAPGIDKTETYTKVLALSNFHKNYLHTLFRVPLEKIIVTRNGIDPKRFENLSFEKEGNRVVYSSSPDRGLKNALVVMDFVIREVPEAELHCYYGFDNMLKNGRKAEVDELQKMIEARSYVKFHGNLEQSKLATELAKAKVWLYPTNFLETYCITALEMQACKVWPVVREWGALSDTLPKGRYDLLSYDETPQDELKFADKVANALMLDKWKTIDFDATSKSWESLVPEWLEFLGLCE